MEQEINNSNNESRIVIPTMLDAFVHFLFGTEKYKPAVIAFVNAVLADSCKKQILSVKILNPFSVQNYMNEKVTILDLLAEDEHQCQYHFEVQVADHKCFVERCVYYMAKTYSGQLDNGEQYTKLNPLTSIILTKFQPIKEVNLLHNSYMLMSKEVPGHVLTNHLEIHFLRVPEKMTEESLEGVSSPLKEWLIFFGYPHRTTMEQIQEAAKKNKGVAMALKSFNEFSAGPDTRYLAEARIKYQRDFQAQMETQWENGLAVGIAQGREEGREEGMVKKALANLIRLVEWKLGKTSSELRTKLQKLTSLQELDQLYEYTMDKFNTLEDFEQYLNENKG